MDICTFDSPVGRLVLTSDGVFLTEVRFSPESEVQTNTANPVLLDTARQLAEYFRCERRIFDLPLRFEGTPWQKRVWGELCRIPFGETLTYGEMAVRCGCPGGARAVGGACHRNPLLIVVPCHRVVAGGGGLCGFAVGVAVKRKLLELERGGILGSPESPA